MFDLESHVQAWRQELAASLDALVVEELENHLREAFEWRTAVGETAEGAWQAALQDIGTPKELAAEFRKLQPARSRLRLPAHIALLAVPVLTVGFLGLLLASFSAERDNLLLATHVLFTMIGYTIGYLIASLMLVAGLVRFIHGMSHDDLRVLGRTLRWLSGIGLATTLLAFFLGGIWSTLHWDRFWNTDPREIGAVVVIAWYGALLLWTGARRPGERGTLFVASMGQLLVSLAWFASFAVERLHSYAAASSIGIIAAVVELILIGLIFLPAGFLGKWLKAE
jgi:hypothetical protein